MTSYVFDNSWEREHERLAGLEAANDPDTTRHLAALGVAPGWRCLEIGAGAGSIAQWLCKRVAPSGKVVATDLDVRFLEALNEPGLDVRRHNLITDDLWEDEFDLIHGRFLIEHLPEPDQIVKKLVAALKPGGWLLLEDADFSPFIAEPPRVIVYPEAVDTVVKVWRETLKLLRQSGYDDEYGRKLPIDLVAAGLVDVGAEANTHFRWGGSPGSSAPVGTLERFREALTDSGAATDEDIDRTIAVLSDPERAGTGPVIVRAWGRRPPDEKRGDGPAKGMPPRTETVRSWLRVSPLFAKTSEVELSRIASLADELHVEAEEKLTIEGEPGTTFFVIAKGTATVSRGGQRLAGLGPGSYFGEIALIESGPRTATVTADSRMWLFVFDAAGFASLMNGIPAVADEIFRALAQRKAADRSSKKRR